MGPLVVFRAVRLLAALLLVSLVLGGASAQNVPNNANGAQLLLALDDPGGVFEPGQNATMDLHVTYTEPTGAAPAPAADSNDPTSSDFQPTRVTFAVVKQPSWIDNVTFVPAVLLIKVTPGSGKATPLVKVVAHVKKDAPAGLREPMIVSAHADQNGGIGPADAASPEITIKAGNVPRVKVEPVHDGAAIVPGGRASPIQFRVTNVGNVELSATLNVTVRPENSLVEFPPSVHLQRNESQIVEVLLTLPWTYGEAGELTLEAKPQAGDDEGKVVKASLDINGQSAVPDVGSGLALLGFVGLAMLLRRR